VHVLTPLIVNIFAALALLLVATVLLAKMLPKASIWYLSVALVTLVLVVPLPGLALIGMEHVLHSLAMVVLVAAAAWIASLPKTQATPASTSAMLLIAAFASGALRYESCFAVLVILVVLMYRGRIVIACATVVAAGVGPLLYGLYSHAHSGLWLPFSVFMKSSGHGVHLSPDTLLTSSVAPILVLLAVTFFLRLAQNSGRPQRAWSFGQSFLLIALTTTLLHAMEGPAGWLMRYEAYLYVLGILGLTLAAGEAMAQLGPTTERSTSQRWVAVAVVIALLPAALELLHRAHHGWSDIAASIHDRYVEHLSQALFVGQETPHAVVIANDIGFLAFYAPAVQILDPLGLGSIEPVQRNRSHQPMTPQFMQQWGELDKAQFAILHTDFPGMETMIPQGWVLVESWCFPHNLVFQNHVESFYAPNEAAADTLRRQLGEFDQTSPELVRYRFPHAGATPPAPLRGETAVCPVPAS
jgi:hypothetical protein